jgi:ribosome-binding factor A
LQSTLAQVPELKENAELYLEIDNSIQNNLITSIKPELVSFLRRELRNSKIELTVKVTENIKNKIIYTDADKFDEMAKKNPSLAKLKQKFNLDFGE